MDIAAPAPYVQPHGVTKDLEQHSAVDSRHMILIDQMIAWAIANPGQPWSKCAPALGLSKLWVLTVASTDAFRARWAQVRDDVIRETGLVTLKDKITAAADIALERIAEKLPTCESMGDLKDTAEMLLNAKYGAAGAGPQAPTHVTVQQQIILDGRQRIIDGHASTSVVADVGGGVPS